MISEIKKIDFVKNIKSTQDGKIFVFTSNGSKVIPMIFKTTVILKIKINSIIMSQPKLDDVFIKYTGKEIRNDNDGFNRKKEHKKMTSIRK